MSMIPFDDRDGSIWYDGRLVPWRDAKLHVLSHGLHYASCVFEGERVYNGAVFRLDDHNERLVNSARILGFEVPASMDELTKATNEVIASNNIVDGYVRPIAWRGAEQMGVSAQATKIHLAHGRLGLAGLFLARSPRQRHPHEMGAVGAPGPAHRADPGQSVRALHDLHDVEARRRSRWLRRRADARLAGPLAEGTGANLFLVINGELHTPTPDCFLNGITRQTVIGLAKKRGIKVVERAIMPEELGNGRRDVPDRFGGRGDPGRRDHRRARPLPLHPGRDLPADVGGLRPHRRQENRNRERRLTAPFASAHAAWDRWFRSQAFSVLPPPAKMAGDAAHLPN